MAVPGFHRVRRDLDDLLGARDAHAQVLQRLGDRLCDALRKHRQDARIGVQDRDVEKALGIDVRQAVCGEHARGVVQLGCELDSGRSTADDDDAKPGRRARGPVVGCNAGVDQTPVEEVRLGRRFQRKCMLRYPGNAEGIRDAADGNHQRVIVQPAPRDHLGSALVDRRCHGDLAA